MTSIFAINRTALVTGASAGIGLELVRELAPRVDTLIIVARRVDRLQSLAAELGTVYTRLRIVVDACDLSHSDAVDGLTRRLDTSGLPIDILVNNAGLGENTPFDLSDWSRVKQILDVNVMSVVQLTHALVPSMVRRGHGALLNIGSGAGRAAMPNAAVYSASKHFIRAFSESLRAQLAETGIVVCEAAPGPVETEFDRTAGIEGGATPGQRLFRISARECAHDIIQQFERGTAVIYPGRHYRWLMHVQPLMPRRLLSAQLATKAHEARARDPG